MDLTLTSTLGSMVPTARALSTRDPRATATTFGPSFLWPPSRPVAAMAPRLRTTTTAEEMPIVRRFISGRLRAGAGMGSVRLLTTRDAVCFPGGGSLPHAPTQQRAAPEPPSPPHAWPRPRPRAHASAPRGPSRPRRAGPPPRSGASRGPWSRRAAVAPARHGRARSARARPATRRAAPRTGHAAPRATRDCRPAARDRPPRHTRPRAPARAPARSPPPLPPPLRPPAARGPHGRPELSAPDPRAGCAPAPAAIRRTRL